MLREQITQGADFADVLDTYNRDGTVPTNFLNTDVLSSVFWDGQNQASLFSPAVSWNDSTTGKINFAISAAQAATLDAMGTYRCQVFATRAGVRPCIADFLVAVAPSAGSGSQPTLTYGAYSDMLGIADWISGVQDADTDQEGFYSQRLKARLWFDSAVINSYTNNYLGLYGRHSEMAFAFAGGYGMRQSTGPNPTIMGYLTSNFLIIRPDVVEACSHYAISCIGLGQMGLNPTFVKYGYYHRVQSQRLLTAITAEINPDQTQAIASIFVNLGATNTLLG